MSNLISHQIQERQQKLQSTHQSRPNEHGTRHAAADVADVADVADDAADAAATTTTTTTATTKISDKGVQHCVETKQGQ